MELFIALGMEMGSWAGSEERKFFVMLQDERIVLTSDQYDLWILGQQAGFTPERAAQYFKKEETAIRKQLTELEKMGVILFWDEQLTDAELANYTITPRGHAASLTEDGQQLLVSYVHAKPVNVDTFGHALWMYGNGLVSIKKVLILVANHLKISVDEAHQKSLYWIPYLIRHGLVILNPALGKGKH